MRHFILRQEYESCEYRMEILTLHVSQTKSRVKRCCSSLWQIISSGKAIAGFSISSLYQLYSILTTLLGTQLQTYTQMHAGITAGE